MSLSVSKFTSAWACNLNHSSVHTGTIPGIVSPVLTGNILKRANCSDSEVSHLDFMLATSPSDHRQYFKP